MSPRIDAFNENTLVISGYADLQEKLRTLQDNCYICSATQSIVAEAYQQDYLDSFGTPQTEM